MRDFVRTTASFLCSWALGASVLAQGLVPAGDVERLHADSAGDQLLPAAAALTDGSFVAVWQDGGTEIDPTPARVAGRLVSPDGRLRGELRVGGAGRSAPDVAALPGNRFVVVWEEADGVLRARRFEAPGAECARGEALCLGEDGRFRVRVEWRRSDGGGGLGHAVPLGRADSGLFYFFGENNVEVLVKVLDGCQVNGQFWVFYAATTQLGLAVTVTDTWSGRVATYGNPPGRPAATVTDTSAFATCSDPAVVETPRPVGEVIEVAPDVLGHRFRPSVATFADGGFVVVWADRERPIEDFEGATTATGRRFRPDGTPAGEAFSVGAMTRFGSLEVDVFPDGGFMVLRGFGAIFLRRYARNGRPVGEERISVPSPRNMSLAAGREGGFAVSWERFEFIESGFSGLWESTLHSRVFGPAGVQLGSTHDLGEPVRTHTFGGSAGTAVDAFGGDRFVVVADSPAGGMGRVLGADGGAVGDVFPAPVGETPDVAGARDGALVVSRGATPDTQGDVFGRVYRAVPEPPELCVDDETLCLGESGRFQVRVRWTTAGGSGAGKVFDLDRHDLGPRNSGTFYFFGRNNVELLVKALDGCGLTGHYWVFFAATTNVGFDLTVTDTRSGSVKTYRIPSAGRPTRSLTRGRSRRAPDSTILRKGRLRVR